MGEAPTSLRARKRGARMNEYYRSIRKSWRRNFLVGVFVLLGALICVGMRTGFAADAEDVVVDDFSPNTVKSGSDPTLCCVCNYNGDPQCDVPLNPIPKDCVWDNEQKRYRNRWKRNCEELQIPPVCNVVVRNDIQAKIPIDSFLETNKCTGYYEWNYIHGDSSMCPEYFERLYCIAAKGINGHIFMSSCLIFESQLAVEAEMKKIAKLVKAECLDVTVSITATPHIQSIATYGFPLTCKDPTGTGMNHPMTVEVKPGGECRIKYPTCKEVSGKPCQSSQQGNVARCLEGAQVQEYTCYSGNFGYQWGSRPIAPPQSPAPPSAARRPVRRR